VKVVIAGGSGYIGRHLAARLRAEQHQVVILSRAAQAAPGAGAGTAAGARSVVWDASTASGSWVSELNGADAVVNLAGTSIGARWTRKNMAAILGSRLAATGALVSAIGKLDRRPAVLVSASGIDFYGNRGDELVDENSAAGDSFLADVCRQWETAAEAASPLGVRVVRIRTSMVFGRGAPAFGLLTLPFRLFAGGPLGNGRQWFTWIHVDDLVALYRRSLGDSTLSGPINAVAPDLRRQRDVAAEIGRVMHRPALLPAPAPMLRLALGRQSELLLHGRRAVPTVAQAHGFNFMYGTLPVALQQALKPTT
jgi:uncharacterized protein (TIGR01777 family)